MSWCQTYTGQISYPLEPEREQVISIEDIAHALAFQCRYNGHCKHFYSVAEHSVFVAREAFRRTNSYEIAMKGLLHDATEAYLGDMPRPIKALIPEFKKIEAKWHSKIFAYYGLSEEMPSLIKEIDTQLLYTEALQIMVWPPPQSWYFPDDIEAINVTVGCISPEEAERSFANHFEHYLKNL